MAPIFTPKCKDNVTRGCADPHSYDGAQRDRSVGDAPGDPPPKPGNVLEAPSPHSTIAQARGGAARLTVVPTHPTDERVPAVVVGGTLNSLGVIRSLAPAGVPVYVLDTNRRCPAAWSRYGRFRHTPSLENGDLIDTLEALSRKLNARPVLILTTDAGVTAVSAARQRVQARYRVSLPVPQMVDALVDKGRFHDFATRERFPIPRGLCITGKDDVPQIRTLTAPFIIKPSNKVLVLKGIVERAVRADTTAEAEAIAARMLQDAPRLIVQEWVEGLDSEIFFTLFACDRQGRVLGLFAGRKVACSPPAVGNTAICLAAPEVADELNAQTLRFIETTAYRGLGSLEFKRDARSGQFVIIEPTVGRTDWQEEIATLCGVNLPLLAYRSELGLVEPNSATPSSRPVAWRSSRGIHAPSMARAPGLRLVDGYWRWSDPLPGLYYYGYERFVRRIWRRATAPRGS